MRIPKLAMSAAALILFAGAALAQTSSISGEVKGEDGKPLKDAIIKITRTDIKGNYKTKTNKKGEYIHAGLPLGKYNVVLEVNGQDVDRVDNVQLRFDPAPINFDMQATAKRRAAMMAAAEAGQLTADQARGLTAEQKAQLEKATKDRQAAMAKNKALNDAFNAGMVALNAKQYDEAAQSFEKASEMDPKQHVVWAHLADSYVGQAEKKAGPERDAAMQKALDAWAKAIELNPNDGPYHNNYALALVRAKKIPEAQAELTKAATLNPEKAGQYYYNLGAVLTNAGQSDQAGEAFKKAIELDPNYAEAHYQYGLYLIGKAQLTPDGKTIPPEGTREQFQKYLELAPTGPNAEAAKAMLSTLESQIQTEYKNPNAPPKKGTTRKK